MADNYFDPIDEAPVARDTASADASKSGVRKAWDAWTSKPENNAALLQFGIAMMQPRGQGQSSFGQFGNAIGEAGEASTRNLAAQSTEADREAKRAELESTSAFRLAQGKAALQNADIYGRSVDKSVGPEERATEQRSVDENRKGQLAISRQNADIYGRSVDKTPGAEERALERQSVDENRRGQLGVSKQNADSYGRQVDQTPGGSGLAGRQLSGQLRTQQAFRAWMAKPEDLLGADPLLGAIQKEFPTIKTKADLISNPLAQKRAFQIYSAQLTAEPEEPASAPAAQPAQSGVATPQIKTFYNKNTGKPEQFRWDGTRWTPLQ